MKKYLLDTNMISFAVRQHPNVCVHLSKTPIHTLYTSSISYTEVQIGLANKPNATRLKQLTDEFFKRITVLPYTEETALNAAIFQKHLRENGKALSALDFLIAAHAVSEHCILVSNDQAFAQIPNLLVEDWTKD